MKTFVFQKAGRILTIGIIITLIGYLGLNQYIAASAVSSSTEAVTVNSDIESNSAIRFVQKSERKPKPIVIPDAAANAPVVNNNISNQPTADASLPTYININGYVSAPIYTVGLDSGGAIAVPDTAVGWWNGSSKPRLAGAVFLDGHSSGVFRNLSGVSIGMKVTVTMGDGSAINYRVVERKVYDYVWQNPSDKQNIRFMSESLNTWGGVAKGLNMMTCYGKWVGDTYSQRLVIFTQQI